MLRAIVAGATGAVGRALTTKLRESDRYGDVHLLLRRQICAANPKLIQHIVDFDSLDRAPIEGPIDHVFCSLGTALAKVGSKRAFRQVDYDYVLAIGALAARYGASMAVVSSVGASPRALSFYLRVKGQAEQALIDLGLERLVILRPSLLIAHRKETRPMEELATVGSRWLAPFFIGPIKRYRPVRVEDVATRMIHSMGGDGAKVKVVENEDIFP